MPHYNQRLFNKVLTLTILGLASVCIFLLQALPIGAQSDLGILPGETNEQPKDRTPQVTAAVSDIENPTTPILVAPTDDSKHTQNKPTFIWKSSTDNFAMSHYVLVFNGTTKFNNIPLVNSDNSDYTLTYNSTTDEYSLVVKSSLSDGSYTWKVLAVDIHDNQASSVTWDFSIDTKAPTFIITTIDGQTVSITNQDVSTVPTTAIELTNNQPTLSGTGEGNSTVKLTVTLPDGSTQTYNFSIGSDGKWSVSLDTLLRDVAIYLDFVITDSYGNISILSDVPLTLPTPVLIIPLPSLPSEPESPTESPRSPEIVIPLVPLPELLPPIIRTIPKQVVYYVRNFEATARQVTVSLWENFWWSSVPLLLIALPLLKLLLLAIWWWPYLSAQLLKQLLWVVGWWWPQHLQGMVISRSNQECVGFSLVTVSGKTAAGLPYKQEVISNQEGSIPQLQLLEGSYRISMQHPLYFFPTLKKRPEHPDWNTYYTGSEFTVKKDDADCLLVLVAEPLEYTQNTQSYLLKQSILRLPSLSVPLAVLASCITVIFPGILNSIAVCCYLLLLGWKTYRQRVTNLELEVLDAKKMPVNNVLIALRAETQKYFAKITQTNATGISKTSVDQGDYQLWVVDLKKKLTEGDKKTMTTVKVSKPSTYYPVLLTE